MKLDINPKLTKEQIGEFEELTFDISDEDKGLLLAAFADGIYSQKIDSLVREIVSNAVDSHLEAGTDDPVIVEIVDTFNEQPYLRVIDTGVGISPERVVNVFVNYFKSTKRDSNLQIGGYGIGAKSPLSYTDLFYVETVYDGIEYNYVVHKGTTESLLPKMVLSSREETDAANGTSIIVPIKSRSDIDKFKEAIRRQLAYFHGVYFKGVGVDNEFTLYQGDNFYYRSQDHPTDVPHISLGGVYYPINWDAVGHDFRHFAFPVALTFEVGELTVTMNREQIEYRDDAIAKIRQKFEMFREELKEMIIEQIGNIENPDQLHNYQVRSSNYTLTLPDGAELQVPNKFINARMLLDEKYEPMIDYYEDEVITSMPMVQGCVNASFKITHVLRGGRMNRPRGYETPWWLFSHDEEHPVYLRKPGSQMSKLRRMYIESLHPGKAVFFITTKNSGIRHAYGQSNIAIQWGDTALVPESVTPGQMGISSMSMGKREDFIKALSSHFIDWYTRDVEWADEIEIPEDFELKEEVIDGIDYAALRKSRNEYLVHRLQDQATQASVHERRWNPEKATFNQLSVSIPDLEEPKLVVWGIHSERDALLLAKSVLSYIKSYRIKWEHRWDGKDEALGNYAVIHVSQENVPVIRKLPNSIHVNDFLMGKHTTIQKVATAVYLRDRVWEYDRVVLKDVHDDTHQSFTELREYIEQYGDYGRCHLGEELEKELIHVLKENELLDEEIIEQMEECDDYMKDVELLKYIQDDRRVYESEDYKNAAASYLKANNKPVNKQYYEHDKRNEAGGDLPAGGDRRAIVSENHEDAEDSDGDIPVSSSGVELSG